MKETKPDYVKILRLLVEHDVSMVVIGAVAMILRAASHTTFDIDICYEQSPENAERVCRALAPICPAIRSAFTDTIDLLATDPRGGNFKTDAGEIDLMVEVSGLGDYKAVQKHATRIEVDGFTVETLTLEGLIEAKEAANRPKDQEHLIILRALKEMEDKEEDAEE